MKASRVLLVSALLATATAGAFAGTAYPAQLTTTTISPLQVQAAEDWVASGGKSPQQSHQDAVAHRRAASTQGAARHTRSS